MHTSICFFLKFSVALFNFRLILVVNKDLHNRGNRRRININFRGIKEALNLLFSFFSVKYPVCDLNAHFVVIF